MSSARLLSNGSSFCKDKGTPAMGNLDPGTSFSLPTQALFTLTIFGEIQLTYQKIHLRKCRCNGLYCIHSFILMFTAFPATPEASPTEPNFTLCCLLGGFP